ncbi:MAG: hypothetical protein FWC09_02685 [Lachnospiraceae bacterium]|nr:hypothetical protein [Lachnospiraceae bacterium]
MNTQLRKAHEMGTAYASILPTIMNHGRVVITDNTGKGESVILNIAEYDAMKEAAWNSYITKSLNEVEAVKDDPTTWLNLDEFFED